MAREIATLGNGCFWCTEAVFQRLKGVESVVSGYTGGMIATPTYREICSGLTGHAEAIRITYDPEQITFLHLLQVFFTTHDPTTLNRQGNDTGTQYRSAIFYHNEQQKSDSEEIIAGLNEAGAWGDPIVTQVEEAGPFYPAEDYHQDYYNTNTNQGYCQYIIVPKLKKLEKLFANLLKEEA